MQDHRAGIEALAGHGPRAATNDPEAGLLASFEGTADPAMISTRSGNEVAILRRRSPGRASERPRAFEVARPSARLIVHPGNPARAILFDGPRRVPRGEITHRRASGGPNLPVRVVATRDGVGVSATVAGGVIGPGAPIVAPGGGRVRRGSRVAAVVEQERATSGLARREITRGRAVADLVAPAPIERGSSPVTPGEPTPEAAAAIEAARAVADRVSGD